VTDDGPDSSADPASPKPVLELLDEADSLENASDEKITGVQLDSEADKIYREYAR
jgi:hypothetical protein